MDAPIKPITMEKDPVALDNKYFELIFRESHLGIGLIGHDFRFFEVNQAFCAFTGYTKKELLKMTFREITQPAGLQLDFNQIHSLIDGSIPVYKTEKRYQQKNGETKWGSLTITVTRDEEGDFLYLMAIVEDITGRKNAELYHNATTQRSQVLLSLYRQSHFLSDEELYDLAVDFAVKMTHSEIGFLHQVDDDQQHILLTKWNTESLKSCTAQFDDHYPVSRAGNWADCINERRPIIYNDFPSSPNQKGLPEGHSVIRRFMSVPVFIDEKVKLVFGVGNKLLPYDDDDLLQVMLVAEELTKILERSRNEEEIKSKNESLHGILESTGDGIVVIDNDNNILHCNRLFAGYCNESVDTLLHANGNLALKSILKQMHQPDAFLEKVRSLFKSVETNVGNVYFKDGRIFECTSHPLIIDNAVVGRVWGFRDITALKKAEDSVIESQSLYHDLLETSLNMIFQSDAEGRYVYLNSEWENVFGYKTSEMLGKKYSDFIAPELVDRDYQEFQRLLLGNQVRNYETTHIGKDGRRIELLFNSKYLIDPQGKVVGIRGSAIDITSRKKQQVELEKMNRELKDLNATKDKFFSIIAHDLRGQFNGLLGFSEILSDPDQDLTQQQVKQLSGNLHAMLKNQYNLLQNLLEWARIQRGSIHCVPETVNLCRIVDNIYGLLAVQMIKKGIQFSNTVAESVQVKADVHMLQSMLQNIFTNALKFSHKGGHILVHAEQEKDFIRIRVQDNGVGMSKEVLSNILKLDSVYTSKGTDGEKGTGLGVVLIKEMAEKQGGWISIESVENEGTTFNVYLPVIHLDA